MFRPRSTTCLSTFCCPKYLLSSEGTASIDHRPRLRWNVHTNERLAINTSSEPGRYMSNKARQFTQDQSSLLSRSALSHISICTSRSRHSSSSPSSSRQMPHQQRRLKRWTVFFDRANATRTSVSNAMWIMGASMAVTIDFRGELSTIQPIAE